MDSSALSQLLSTGNYRQTIAQGKRFLQEDPNDLVTHYCLAYSYVAIGEISNAWPHLDFTLSRNPNDSCSHLLAAVYFKAVGDDYRAEWYCDTGLQLDPENSIFYFFKAEVAVKKLKLELDHSLIDQALKLDPDDPDYRHFLIHLQGVTNNSLTSSWEKIEKLKETLGLDPDNAAIHHSIGDVFLDEIKDPRQAEVHFRDALRLKPSDCDYQRSLFQAVAQRDLVYRVLSIPSRTCQGIGHLIQAISLQPWRIIFLVIGFKGVILAAIWLVLVVIFFWPAAKIYEWMIVSEFRNSETNPFDHCKYGLGFTVGQRSYDCRLVSL